MSDNHLPPTIGILTALPKECAAVRLMLENETRWKAPGEGGGRDYYLGEIPAEGGGSHHIAVALLLDMGNSSAAIRATLLLQHFPSVRHIIMCGIAGGVPKPGDVEHDVRLGDIVVSNRNGVVQYDLIKERPDGTREHRHPPRPPGAELLDAVRHLLTEEELGHHPWEEFLPRGEKMKNGRRPSDNQDARGEPVTYPPDRERRSGLPRIFHGSIAAANILLKNAEHRDYLGDTFAVKAVEMEGAGVADATWTDGAGYLVVRGICDYCDGSKGDLWQGAAAVAAATYVRALIGSMPLDAELPPVRKELRETKSHADPIRYVDCAIEHFGMTFAESESFVEQECRDGLGRVVGTAREYLLGEVRASGPRFVLLLGDYGSGKSTQLHAVFKSMALGQHAENGSQLPLFIRLATWRRGISIWDCALEQAIQFGCNFDRADIWERFRRGHVALLCDGFDEIPDTNSEQDLANRLHDLRSLAVGEAKVIVASRRHFFRSDAEIDGLLSVSDRLPSRTTAVPSLAYLEDFSDKNVRHVIQTNLSPANAGALKAFLDRDPDLARIARRPLLLTMLVNIFPRVSVAPLQLAGRGVIGGIYERYVADWFAREMRRGVLTTEQRIEFCCSLAVRLDEGQRTSVREHEIRALMRELGVIAEPSSVLAASADVRTATLIVRDAAGNYSFSHRSFAEYFHASALARSLRLRLQGGESSKPWFDKRQLGETTAVFLQGMIAAFSEEEVCRLAVAAIQETHAVVSLNLARCLLGLGVDQILAIVAALGEEGTPTSPCAKDTIWALGEVCRTLDDKRCQEAVLSYLQGTVLTALDGAVAWNAAFAIEKLNPTVNPIDLLLEVRRERWNTDRIIDCLQDRAAVVAAIRYQRSAGASAWVALMVRLADVARSQSSSAETRYNAIWLLGWSATVEASVFGAEQLRRALHDILRVERVNYVHSNAVEALAKFRNPGDLNIFLEVVRREESYFRSKVHAVNALFAIDAVSARHELSSLIHLQTHPAVAELITTRLKEQLQ